MYQEAMDLADPIEFRDRNPSYTNMVTNYQIAAAGVIPFIILVLVYILICCRRKVTDYYLKVCAYILMITIILRISMSFIVATIYYVAEKKGESENQVRLLVLKLQIFEFSLPYYCFLMISVTLIVSSMQFYVNLRALLYPEIEA